MAMVEAETTNDTNEISKPVKSLTDAERAMLRLQMLFESTHDGNQVTAAKEFQHLAKTDVATALGAGVLHQVIAMLYSPQMKVRAAAAAALAALCTTCDGRDAARYTGALPPLVQLLKQQQNSPAEGDIEHASKAIMNAAACDLAKVAIHKADGTPTLLNVLQSGSQLGANSSPFSGAPRGAPCPTAVYAVGALMNMILVKKVRETLAKENGLELLYWVADKHASNVLGARARNAALLLEMHLSQDDFLPQANISSASNATSATARTVQMKKAEAAPVVVLHAASQPPADLAVQFNQCNISSKDSGSHNQQLMLATAVAAPAQATVQVGASPDKVKQQMSLSPSGGKKQRSTASADSSSKPTAAAGAGKAAKASKRRGPGAAAMSCTGSDAADGTAEKESGQGAGEWRV